MKFNEEQFEAHLADIDNQLTKFQETLPDNKKQCFIKIREMEKLCKENNVPFVFFAKFQKEGFHQWRCFQEDGNIELNNIHNFYTKAWPTIGQFVFCALEYIGMLYGVRLKMYSNYTKELLYDNHAIEE